MGTNHTWSHTIKTLGLLAARAFSLGRANGVCDSRLSALLSFVGLLVFLLLHLLHLDVLKRGLDLTQVLPEILDRARQHPFLDLGVPHGRHELHLPHRKALDKLVFEVALVVVVADHRELLLLAVVFEGTLQSYQLLVELTESDSNRIDRLLLLGDGEVDLKLLFLGIESLLRQPIVLVVAVDHLLFLLLLLVADSLLRQATLVGCDRRLLGLLERGDLLLCALKLYIVNCIRL